MNKTYSFFYIQILFMVYFIHIDYCNVYAGDLSKQESKLNTLIEKLHSMYKDAFENGKTYITRRFFTNDGHSHYTLHVQKLKDVDGVKIHNLKLEGRSQREDPIIYINNPVEARIPNSFISIDQFKKAMFERVKKQKKEFDVKRNLLIKASKHFKVLKNLENFSTEIFDVQKHVKQVFDISNNTELTTKKSTNKLMKTTLHNGSIIANKERKQKIHTKSTTAPHIVNKKRAHKVYVSRGTKSTRIPRIMTTTTLPKMIADKEITTKTDENMTTESTADEDITTETTADQEMNTETITDDKITTETASDEKNTTQTAETTADDGITTETIADEEINTETTAAEEINTEIIVNEEITTELIAMEVTITEPVTTTEPTVRTTRTKQLRPYVYLGDR